MGLIGIIIASIVNIFMKSSMMYFVNFNFRCFNICWVLKAYDTQKIKNMYVALGSGELKGKKAVKGALTLYLDFIKFFYNVVKIIWAKKINLFLKFLPVGIFLKKF
ncbi:MAG: hypothetical protein CM1200mP13_00840 [Candidatus Pelagibacterales bacterium]|nr:MAG: hypothetical protein CM1200mP13_00840 [Pelagibacterales bacterium]